MSIEVINTVLSKFGITRSKSINSSPVWTLQISPSASGLPPQTATFDEQQAGWRINERNSANDQDVLHQTGKSGEVTKTALQNSEIISSANNTDWTEALLSSEHVDFFRSHDWAATPLGSLATRPHALRLYSHMLFSDKRPVVIYWGSQHIAIYNESFVPLIDQLHPTLIGRSVEKMMPKLWEFFAPKFRAIETDQTGLICNSLELPVVRHGYLEETWWDGALVPLKDDQGKHGGVYVSWMEVTKMILRDRRTALVNRLERSSQISSAKTWHHIHQVFLDSPKDITMAMMYGAGDAHVNEQQLYLKSTIGIGYAFAAAHDVLHSIDDDSTLSPLLRRARDFASEFIILDLSKDEVSLALLDHVKWQGHGEPSQHIAVIPLRVRNITHGYIILGLNPRRDFDADHRKFVADLAYQLRELIANSDATIHIKETLKVALADHYDSGSNRAMLWKPNNISVVGS